MDGEKILCLRTLGQIAFNACGRHGGIRDKGEFHPFVQAQVEVCLKKGISPLEITDVIEEAEAQYERREG